MRHISAVSKKLPAHAAEAGPLTNWNKATPGLFGLNVKGDLAPVLGALPGAVLVGIGSLIDTVMGFLFPTA